MPFTFQNRPPVAAEPLLASPHAGPLALGSGDIEAVEYPRMPAFPQPPARPVPHALRPPVPSPSLAPVAMNAVRGRADSTVPPPPRGSTPEMVVRTRPTLKAGFGILVAGAIVGSLLGIMTTPKHAVAAAHPPATEVANAGVAQAEPLPPVVKVDAPSMKTDAPKDDAAEDAKPATTAKKKRGGAAIPVVRTTVASAGTKPVKAEKPAKDDDGDDGYRVASADPGGAKASAGSKKKPAPKDDDDDAPAPPPKKKPKASDDAASVLRAAMGATENTL